MPARSYAAHKKRVADWVKSYLATKHAVSAETVKRSHKLRHWGVVHEGHLADLAGSYNRAVHIDPAGESRIVIPPDLIEAMGEDASGRNVAHLMDFVSSATYPLTRKYIEDRLIIRLNGERGTIIKGSSSLGGLTVSAPAGHLIDLDLDPDGKKAHEYCQICIDNPGDLKKTVTSVADCMYGKLRQA